MLFVILIFIISEVITQHFPGGWEEAKAAIDQYGLDLQKREKRKV